MKRAFTIGKDIENEEHRMKKILTLLLCLSLLTGALGVLIGAAGEQTATQTTESGQDSAAQTGQTTLPTKATFTLINAAMGYGSGTLSMEMPAESNAASFALYWGDAQGARLPSMTPFLTGEIKTSVTSVSTAEAPSIPEGAACILLYTYNAQHAESPAPYKIPLGNYSLPDTGKKVSEFIVVSDLHIGSGKTAEKNMLSMLNDVRKNAPDAVGIMVVGDAVEAADEEFYRQISQIRERIEGAPPIYCGIGDRSFMEKGSYEYNAAKHAQNLQLFLQYAGHPMGTKLDKPYYSYMLGDALMVFIGADSYQNGNAVYSEAQLTWLDGVLRGADAYEPVFVFMHEPLPNTVSGSLSAQGYGNVHNPDDVKKVLNQYKNVYIFNGHTQWSLEAERTMYYLSSDVCAFNTAGVAHLWEEKDGAGYEVAGNQGYYVTVYEDAVLIRGRNFATGEWISNAIYMFSSKPAPVQNPPSTQAPKPSVTTKPAEEQTTEAEDESGIGGLIPPLCILGCMAVIVFIFIFRKPKEQA